MRETVSLVESGTTFEPEMSNREVVIAAPDICFEQARRVCQRLATAGPGLRLRLTGASNGIDRVGDVGSSGSRYCGQAQS